MTNRMLVERFARIAALGVAGVTFLALPLQAQTSMGSAASPATPPVKPDGHPSADSTMAVVSLLATINRDEIAAGKLAASRATRADVRAYAQRMVTEHSKALDSLKANAEAGSWIVKDTSGMPPGGARTADSAGVAEMHSSSNSAAMTEGALHGANQQTMSTLQAASGSAFDRAYIDAQVKAHQAVLKAITGQPTSNEKLQTQLTKTQKAVEIHLDDARKLQTSMGSGASQSPEEM